MKNKKYKYHKNCNIIADDVMKNGILIGCHQGMTISDINLICEKFNKFIKR